MSYSCDAATAEALTAIRKIMMDVGKSLRIENMQLKADALIRAITPTVEGFGARSIETQDALRAAAKASFGGAFPPETFLSKVQQGIANEPRCERIRLYAALAQDRHVNRDRGMPAAYAGRA